MPDPDAARMLRIMVFIMDAASIAILGFFVMDGFSN
jgi:hypothetical protein